MATPPTVRHRPDAGRSGRLTQLRCECASSSTQVWHSTSRVVWSIPNASASIRFSSPARSCASCRLNGPAEHHVRRQCRPAHCPSSRGGGDARPRRRPPSRARRRTAITSRPTGTASSSTRVASRTRRDRGDDDERGDQERRDRVEASAPNTATPTAADDYRRPTRAHRLSRCHSARSHVEAAVRVPMQHRGTARR